MSVKVTVGQQTFIKKIVLGTPVTTARETLSIDEFTDFNVATKSDAQILVFDSAEGVFKNYTFDVGQGLAREYSPGDDKLTIAIDSDKTPVVTGILSKGNLTPTLDSTFDLGDSNRKWKDLHLSGSTIHLGGIKLKDSGGDFSVKDSTGTPVNIDLAGSIQQIRGFFSPGGDLSYDSTTGRFEFDVEQVYTKANFDSDLGDALDGGVGITYDSANDTIRIDSAELEANFKQDIRGYFTADKGLVYSPTTGNFDVDSANLKTIISATDAGGDGSFSYNNSTGVFTYTGPSASEVRNHFSASNGLSYNSSTGDFRLPQPLDSSDKARFSRVMVDSARILDHGLVSGALQISSYANAINSTGRREGVLYIGNDAQLGAAGGDLTIYHNDSGAQIENRTGDLSIKQFSGSGQVGAKHINITNHTNDGDIVLSADWPRTTGAQIPYVEVKGQTGEVRLFHKDGDQYDSSIAPQGREKFRTQFYGARVYGFLRADNIISLGSLSRATAVDSATYGSATQIPVLTVNTSGFIDSIGTVAVAGVSSTSFDSTSGIFTINTADGNSFPTHIQDSADLVRISRKSLSATDAGGDGSFSYNNTTGVFTYTGPSASEVRAHITGGSGIGDSVNGNGIIKIDSAELYSLYKHDDFSDFVADEHVAHSDVNITAGAGLTGGGNIASTRTLDVVGGKGIIANADDIQVDSSNIKKIFSATDVSGDGSFSYNNSTGVFTYTGPSSTEVRAHFSASNSLSYNSSTGDFRLPQPLDSAANPTFNQLRGPASFVIDPATIGDNTGTVRILGNLQVEGTQTIINSTTVSLNDKNIVIADSAADSSALDGGGITWGGASIVDTPTFNYSHANARLVSNREINAPLFSGSGASLTNLPAASLTGTIDSARIPTLLIADIGNINSIDHDALTNFVANEHIDHTGVSITAGFGLKGGGTIASTRDLAIDSAELLTYYEPIIRHDNLSGFVANEHIDHTGVSVTAGFGLKGGGTIASTRDLAIDSAELLTYYEPILRHDNLSGFVANEHIDHTSVSVIAGNGLAGGGDISSSRTISIDSSQIKGLFSAGGDLSYNSGTGEFSFDVEAVYTKENFDSDYFFAKDSANTAVERNQHDATTKTFAVTVASKSGTHVYQGQGSGNAYYVDGTESPIINLKLGRTYRFNLSSSDMSSHPFRFYYDAARNTQYTTNVTTAATYTEITITEATPPVLHYQCSSHGYMGHALQIGTRNFTGFTTTNLTEGTNLYYTDTRFDNRLATKTTDNLSEGSSNLYYTDARVRAVSLDSAEAQAMIDSNLNNDITFGGDVAFDSSGAIFFDKSDKSLKFFDQHRLKIGTNTGTGGDIEIYHDGNNSYIDAGGSTGALIFMSSVYSFRNALNTEQIAHFAQDGVAQLYHNGLSKIKTDSDGIRVPGIVNQASGIILEDPSNTAFGGHVTFYDGGAAEHFVNGDVVIGGRNAHNRLKNIVLDRDIERVRFPGDVQFDSSSGIIFDVSDKVLKVNSANYKIQLIDNAELLFGTSNDLKIFHNGSNSFIRDQGTGALFVQTSRFIAEDLGSNRIIDGQDGGPVDLYHDGSKKFFTTDSGAEVVGNLITDSATIQGGVLDIKNTGAQSEVRLFCEDANQHYVAVRAPAHSTFSGNVVLTLPSADGTIISTSNSNAPSTTTSAADADFVLIDDGGTMKKITPANLGISSGITIQDSGGTLSNLATTLNFVGAGVTASGSGSTKTITISGGGSGSGAVSGGDTMVQFNDGGSFGSDAEFTFNKTSNTLTIGGPLIATSKSFDIKHPTKKGKRLRYGSLEGPENGVYVRGRANSTKINLPDYWTGLVDEESITVNLTPIGKHQKLYVEDISNNTITIGNDNLIKKEINCFYTVYAERKDINKITVEYKR